MSTSPAFASIITVGSARLTAGDASRTAPTNQATIFTPGASGGMVQRVVVEPVATVTATVVRIFRYDGTTYFLYAEIQVPAQTITGTVAVSPQTLEGVNYPSLFPILVPAGWTLRASINDTQTGVNVSAEGGSL